MTSMYEGIALIQEKQAVVLDLGSDYTKFGFTGEAAPRCIVRSEFWCERRRAVRRVHDYCSPEELYDNLVAHLHQLYFRHVLVNPKERKVVVVESLLTPTLFRETLAKVLFTHYEVSGVVCADSARMCALTLGTPVALVVDIGAREVEVAAVVHGCVVVPGLASGPLGTRALHAELLRLLREDAGQQLQLDQRTLEDITVKTCFVINRARALQWQSERPPQACPGVQYPAGDAGGGTLLVAGRARELAAELLFHRDAELASLPDLVLQCILHAPRDARRALAANMLLAGGGAALPGLQARLAAELRQLVTEEPYRSRLFLAEFKFHAAPAHGNWCAWAGGALAGAALAGGALAGAGEAALPRDRYLRAPRLPDWVCLLDNTPPDHPHRTMPDL